MAIGDFHWHRRQVHAARYDKCTHAATNVYIPGELWYYDDDECVFACRTNVHIRAEVSVRAHAIASTGKELAQRLGGDGSSTVE